MNFRILFMIVKKSNLDRFFYGFVVLFFLSAFIILLAEPQMETYGNALWYLFVGCTSIGFGDIVPLTWLGRIMTVIVTVYEIFLVAMVGGTVVSHYLEVIKRTEEITASVFLDRLQHLTELSEEELKEMEEKARKININKDSDKFIVKND